MKRITFLCLVLGFGALYAEETVISTAAPAGAAAGVVVPQVREKTPANLPTAAEIAARREQRNRAMSDKLMRDFDKNGDGKLDSEELLELVKDNFIRPKRIEANPAMNVRARKGVVPHRHSHEDVSASTAVPDPTLSVSPVK